jgi:hypothetical protein
MAGKWRNLFKRLIPRLPQRKPKRPKHDAQSGGTPVSDLLDSLTPETSAPPPPPDETPASPRRVDVDALGSIRNYANDTFARGVDIGADFASVDDAARELALAAGRAGIAIARDQNNAVQAFQRGSSELGAQRWYNQVQIMQRALGVRIASVKLGKADIAEDWVHWFWYHGKRIL